MARKLRDRKKSTGGVIRRSDGTPPGLAICTETETAQKASAALRAKVLCDHVLIFS